MTLPTRTLGTTSALTVSTLGFGCMGMSEFYGAPATEKGCTPAQLALAWVLAQGEDVVPIPGTKRVRYLEENVAAAQLQLDADDLDALMAPVPRGAVVGDRYGDMSSIDG